MHIAKRDDGLIFYSYTEGIYMLCWIQ